MTLTPLKHDIQLSELDAWGTVTDLGSQLLEGDGKAFGKMTFGTLTDPVSSAYFGTTQGKFRMVYPFTEQATVVTGEVLLTDETSGQQTHFKAGDSWFVTKGTAVLWEIVSPSFVKHYFAFA